MKQVRLLPKVSEPLQTYYLQDGFVEQDAEHHFSKCFAICKKLYCSNLSKTDLMQNTIVSIGISNQRETFVVWDKDGKPLYNAVVWQCKRSVQICEAIKRKQD